VRRLSSAPRLGEKAIKVRSTLFRKLAPGRLSRAILALAGRTGNKMDRMAQPTLVLSADPTEALDYKVDWDGRRPKFSRTTITVETERLVVFRSKRSSSRFRTEREPDSFQTAMTPKTTGGKNKS
jgi:hypothetical protein